MSFTVSSDKLTESDILVHVYATDDPVETPS